MTAAKRFAAATVALYAAAERHKPALARALRDAGYFADAGATVRGLVRLARTVRGQVALADFEAALRPYVVEYLVAARKARQQPSEEARFLVDHFDRFTEVPVTAHPVKRVLTWLRRHYRAWRKDREHNVH